jgi:dihydrofolate reductase
MQDKGKLILYIAMSLDGFIAKPDGDIGFLSQVEQEGEDYGYSAFMETIDTVILGRKTYDKILSMGYELHYGEREVYVLTRSPQPATNHITFYSGSLTDLIIRLKTQEGKNIFCDGGAETVHRLLQEDLFDELIVSVIPVLLGDGIRLFKGDNQEKKLQLVKSGSFDKGLVQMHYIIHKN